MLGLPPGPLVGQAWRYLKELRLERGPLPHDEAVAELDALGRSEQGSSRGRPAWRTAEAVARAAVSAYPPATTASIAYDLPGRRQQERGEHRRGHERDVEQRVVEGEDPAAEVVLDLLLHQRVHADLRALGDDRRAASAAGRIVCDLCTAGRTRSRSARASANSPVTQACLPNRRTAAGVIAAAISVPAAVAAKTWPSPASPAWKTPVRR